MELADLLKQMLAVDSHDGWETERTPTFVRRFAVRLHTMLADTDLLVDAYGY